MRIAATLPTCLALCLALAFFTACVRMERQPIDKHYYALETERVASGSAVGMPKASTATLLVRRMQAAPRVSGRELVYRTAPSAWTADYYNLFFVAPADMLTQDLRMWLSQAQLFANVVDPGSLAPSEYTLEGNVSALHGDFSTKPAQAVAEMQFLLLRTTGAERQVVLTRDYRKSVPLASNSPQELVSALREAVNGVYADLESDLRPLLARK